MSDSLSAGDLSDAVGGEDAGHWSVPLFRTVTTATGRHALRLERVFWQAIGVIAAREGRKPNDVVRDLVATAESGKTNLSSGLRSLVLHRLMEDHQRLSVWGDPLATIKLMQMAPTPSFALDRNKHLVRVNDEFVRYLRTVLSRAGPVEQAQLRLDRPAETIFAELSAGAAIECGVSIVVDRLEKRSQARIVLPPHHPQKFLVGFILN